MMTAYHDVGTAVTAMREGAADFLCKPFDLPTLRDVVRRMLGSTGEARSVLLSPPDVHEPDGPATTLVPDREAELLSGRYRLEREIGRGAMATVLEARDTRHDRSVAVKLLRPEVAASIGTERFLREIQIAARIHHPHVLTLIDSGQWQKAPFFVMPLVRGRSLRGRLELDSPLQVPFGASVLRMVADALATAHELDIVHRDIKPENVLLSDRHAWVADFGVARALSGASGVRDTSVGSAIGTPGYMAPEQVSGVDEVDHRADIYALGALAYEVFSGQPPFSRRSAAAILAAHLFDEPPPLRTLRPELPPALEEIVMSCLSKSVEDRPQSGEGLARHFGRFEAEVDR